MVFFLNPLLHLLILRWVVRKLELSSGPPLHFDGGYWMYLGYQLLIGISAIAIIGWAWVLASYYRWLADNTRGKGVAIHCDASGWDIPWRSVVAVLGSLPIVTIPWMCMWYCRWLVSCITIAFGVTNTERDWA